MNLQKLFEMQAKLDADITAHHPVQEGENRLEKKVLALLVELGECAQEWRGFKFWSNDQESRTKVENKCLECKGEGFDSYWTDEGQKYDQCECCCGTGIVGKSNLLLEEYVDCLHFILSIGNELKIDKTECEVVELFHWTTENYFIQLIHLVTELHRKITNFPIRNKSVNFSLEFIYNGVLRRFLGLSLRLGFTWEQIEQAYYDKNKVNFERQEQGY